MRNRQLFFVGLFWALVTVAAAQDAAPPMPASPEAATPGPEPAPAETAATPVEPLPPPTDKTDDEDRDEVIVTATRRAKSLMKIPVAISEISGEALEANVIRDTQSLVQSAPSVNIQFSGSETNATIRIRGIGTGGSNAGFESSVGAFVDGVYLPRPGLVLADLVDVERVEILRGPQGTLFGKNTTVGAIQIYTRQPSFEPQAELAASVGNFDSRVFRFMGNMPVVDDLLAVRLAGQYSLRDGYVKNLYDGQGYNDRDRYVIRGQALFTPRENVSLRLIAGQNNKKEKCCAAPFTYYNPATAEVIRNHGGTVFDPPEDYVTAFNRDTVSKAKETFGSGHLDWDFGLFKSKLLLSYSDGSAADKAEGDFTDIDQSYVPQRDGQAKSTSAELSFQGNYEFLDWLVGGYRSDEEIGAQSEILLGRDANSSLLGVYVPPAGQVVPPGTQTPLYPEGEGQKTASYQIGSSTSLFTHNVIKLPYEFETTIGARYLIEEKTGGGEATTTVPACDLPYTPPGSTAQTTTAPAGNPTATVNSLRVLCGIDPYVRDYKDYRITGTASLGRNFDFGLYLYGSYSKGYKSGGINLNPPSTLGGTYIFRPEKIDNYEAGLRLPLFDKALQLRATYFYMDLKDYQVNAYDGVAFTVSNVEQVISQGVEFESNWRVFPGLTLNANLTYNSAKYGPNVPPIKQSATVSTTVAGKQLTNSPEWVGQAGASFVSPLPHGMAFFSSLSARYQSEVNTGVNLDPKKAQEAYMLLNGRIGFQFPGDLDLSVAASNLTDLHYKQIIFDAPLRTPQQTGAVAGAPGSLGVAAMPGSYNGYPGFPRLISIELRKRF